MRQIYSSVFILAFLFLGGGIVETFAKTDSFDDVQSTAERIATSNEQTNVASQSESNITNDGQINYENEPNESTSKTQIDVENVDSEIDYFEQLIIRRLLYLAEIQESTLLNALTSGTLSDESAFRLAALFVRYYENLWLISSPQNNMEYIDKINYIRRYIESNENPSSIYSDKLFRTRESFIYGINLCEYLLTTSRFDRLANESDSRSPNDDILKRLASAISILDVSLKTDGLTSFETSLVCLIQADIQKEIALNYPTDDPSREENLKRSLQTLRKIEANEDDSEILWLARVAQIQRYRFLNNQTNVDKLTDVIYQNNNDVNIRLLLDSEKIDLFTNQGNFDEARKLTESINVVINDDSLRRIEKYINSDQYEGSLTFIASNLFLYNEMLNESSLTNDSQLEPSDKSVITQKLNSSSLAIQNEFRPYWQKYASMVLQDNLTNLDDAKLIESEAENAFYNRQNDRAIELYDQAVAVAEKSNDRENAFRLAGIAIGILLQQTTSTKASTDEQIDANKISEIEKEIVRRTIETAKKYSEFDKSEQLYLTGLNAALSLVDREAISIDDYLRNRLDFIALYPNFAQRDEYILQTARLFAEQNDEETTLALLSQISDNSAQSYAAIQLAKETFDAKILSAENQNEKENAIAAAIFWFLRFSPESSPQNEFDLYQIELKRLNNLEPAAFVSRSCSLSNAVRYQMQNSFSTKTEKNMAFAKLENVLQQTIDIIRQKIKANENNIDNNINSKYIDEILSDAQVNIFLLFLETNELEKASEYLQQLSNGTTTLDIEVVGKLMNQVENYPNQMKETVGKICQNTFDKIKISSEGNLSEEEKQILIYKAKTLSLLGKSQKSLNQFAALLKKYPDDPRLLEEIAKLLASQNDHKTVEKSLVYWNRVVQTTTNGTEARFNAQEQIILTLSRLGRNDQAKKLIKTIQLTSPDFGSQQRKQRMEQLLKTL